MVRSATKRFSEKTASTVGLVCSVLPFVITPTMLWGFSGQLSPRTYPGEWSEMNTFLKNKKDNKQVLFLPWHQYANYSFSGRLMANPAEMFFEVPMVISDDPEFRSVPPTQPNDEKQQIAALLKDKREFSATLTRLHVGYVLLAKEQEYTMYEYLNVTQGLHLIKENEKLKLYKVGEQ
jgi:hypothetical protein